MKMRLATPQVSGARPTKWSGPRYVPRSALVATEVVVLQRHGLTGSRAERRVVRVVRRDRVHRGLRLFGRLDPDVAVARQAGPGRDQLAYDHVLLKPEQRVRLGIDGRIGQHPGGLLEGGRGQPRVGRQRGLGDPHQDRPAGSRRTAFGHHPAVLLLEPGPLDQLAGQQLGVAGLDDRHPAQHLPDDDLDVLVVDRHTLGPVHLLDLGHQVDLHGPLAEHPEHVVRVDRAGDQLLADRDVVPVVHEQPDPLGHRVRLLLGAVVRNHYDLAGLLGVLDPNPALDLGDRRDALGLTGLEQLHHTRQAVGDVLTRDPTGVEGPHGQLGAGLTDRLGGDDADRLADVDQLAGGQRPAIAGRAGAGLALAGEHATDPELLGPGGDDVVHEHRGQVGAGRGDRVAVDHDVLGQGAGDHAGVDVLVLAQRAVRAPVGDPHQDAAVSAAVLLTDDHVLGDVDQPAGQVTRVGGPQRGVGQTLASAVRRDEVLENVQALPEVRLDRPRNDLTLRVGHQTAHARELADLHRVAPGARVDHYEDGVVLREVLLHLPRDLVRRVGPDLDEFLAALLVGDQTLLVLRLNPVRPRLVGVEDLGLLRWRDHVGDRDGHAGPGGPVEPGLLERVERGRHLYLRVALGQVVDDGRQLLLVDYLIDVGVVGRQRLVEQSAAQRGLQRDRVAGLPAVRGGPAARRHDLPQPDADRGLQVEVAGVKGHDRLGHRAEHPAWTLRLRLGHGQEEDPDDHVLGRHRDRAAVGRLEDVVRGQHQDPGLGLRLGG